VIALEISKSERLVRRLTSSCMGVNGRVEWLVEWTN
jgi:hypothetical protein